MIGRWAMSALTTRRNASMSRSSTKCESVTRTLSGGARDSLTTPAPRRRIALPARIIRLPLTARRGPPPSDPVQQRSVRDHVAGVHDDLRLLPVRLREEDLVRREHDDAIGVLHRSGRPLDGVVAV